ncbi:MAG: ATP-dependent helicase [Solirubrobacterales bacterium]|nr:ATP-dependent helicase [Solirubrobacterales bacterium]
MAVRELNLLSDHGPLDELTAAQRAVATHSEVRLVVYGVAGSGKTRALQARFHWLVSEGCPPERIAVLLPTAGRAQALRARLESSLALGYEELFVLTATELAALTLRGSGGDAARDVLTPGDRLAMLLDRLDELALSKHDFGGRPTALLGGFVRRIDRLKAELVGAERYREWAAALPDDETAAALEREFAEVYAAHERMLAEAGARDDGSLIADALSLAVAHPRVLQRFEHVLIDDAQELDLAPARLVGALAGPALTVAGDPAAGLRRYRGAGAERMASFQTVPVRVVELTEPQRCPPRIWRAAIAVQGRSVAHSATEPAGGDVEFWRCANERSQAQAVAADIERLLGREGVAPGRVAVLVPEIGHEGQAVGVALEERAVAHRLVGEEAFFQRAEIRDVLAWLRLLTDPTDAAAVVRALARPPVELRSVDIARCTQIARRRKLDMVGALAAATESPQVPPEARDRIRVFLKLYRASIRALDSSRPDLYVHRLIERLGLRRQQLFAAQSDVVERLRALAAFGELAGAHVRRAPQATPREFARSIAAVADFGLREEEEPVLADAGAVQVLSLLAAGGLEADHVYVVGLHVGMARRPRPGFEPIPDELLSEPLPRDNDDTRRRAHGQELHVALSRAGRRLILAYPQADDRGNELSPAPLLQTARAALRAPWVDKEEDLFGPAETLHSTYRLLRDELLEGTLRAGSRLGELRFDTDLDVSHAVVRYLELLKLAALLARGGRDDVPSVAESLRDINARILQAVTGEQREIFESSALDDYLLDSERDARRRAQALAARDEPTLEPFLPRRGDGVMLSATDIDTYRTCPLKYKFARVFRIPQEPTVHQRFGIVVHQVLERFHAQASDSLPELLGLLDASWRRGGFADSQTERQLRGKATAALTRYHERFCSAESVPIWFERQFTFRLGPHLLRGRVDRVDRLPDGGYELIDYKTGRPKTADQLADDVQLSLYAVGAREAWSLEASRQAYYYLLDDQKVSVADEGERADWVREVATEVAEGILSQGFEPTPSYAACSICDYRLVCPAAER